PFVASRRVMPSSSTRSEYADLFATTPRDHPSTKKALRRRKRCDGRGACGHAPPRPLIDHGVEDLAETLRYAPRPLLWSRPLSTKKRQGPQTANRCAAALRTPGLRSNARSDQ